MQTLVQYHWPGNIRELENVVERTLLVTNSPRIEEVDLPRKDSRPEEDAEPEAPVKTIKEVERDHILAVLKSS